MLQMTQQNKPVKKVIKKKRRKKSKVYFVTPVQENITSSLTKSFIE